MVNEIISYSFGGAHGSWAFMVSFGQGMDNYTSLSGPIISSAVKVGGACPAKQALFKSRPHLSIVRNQSEGYYF